MTKWISLNFHTSSQKSLWWAPFVQSIYSYRWKITKGLSLMTLKRDVKFEEKLNFGSKNDMRNLVDFNTSNNKFENLHFAVLLFSIAYKVSTKKVQKSYLSWHWKVIQTFWTFQKRFCLKNDMRTLANCNSSSGTSENLHFDGILL